MIRAIIIDDEEDARMGLKLLLEKFCPMVSIVAVCNGPEAGLEVIGRKQPDLIFLDIQMPGMSGFDLLRKVSDRQFKTIFVSAHDHYAIKAIRFSALDYLLKPVDIEELIAAVARVDQKESQMEVDAAVHNFQYSFGENGKFAVPDSQGLIFFDVHELIHCAADGSYTQLYLKDKKPILVSKRLKEFEELLNPKVFCRVHHSSIININHVIQYVKGEGGYVKMSNGEQVNISRRKKDEFMRLIAKL